MWSNHAVRFGYKASAEQFGPRDLLNFSVAAEKIGLETVAISDHFQPWRHHTGHAPYAPAWLGALGQRTRHVTLGTSTLTPTLRHHPAIVAQMFATLACLNPGRVFLGIGSGEAMNERPALGIDWPSYKERSGRIAEAVALLRRLWSEERVTFEGEYYQTLRATIYDRPKEPIPIYVAASGPKAAHLVGRIADGFICTSGKRSELYEELLATVKQGAVDAGRDFSEIDKFMEIKVSYDRDAQYAYDACEWWAALALSTEEKSGLEDPLELERLADANLDRAHTRFIVSDDPRVVLEGVEEYVDLGFTNLVFHGPGPDQNRFLQQFGTDVLPLLRKRFLDGGPVRTARERAKEVAELSEKTVKLAQTLEDAERTVAEVRRELDALGLLDRVSGFVEGLVLPTEAAETLQDELDKVAGEFHIAAGHPYLLGELYEQGDQVPLELLRACDELDACYIVACWECGKWFRSPVPLEKSATDDLENQLYACPYCHAVCEYDTEDHSLEPEVVERATGVNRTGRV